MEYSDHSICDLELYVSIGKSVWENEICFTLHVVVDESENE